MEQLAIIREQQEPGRIGIQPSDRRERRAALQEARGQKFVDQAPLVGAGAGKACRLVQHQHHAGRRVERVAVKSEIVACAGYAACADRGLHFLAAAIAKVRQILCKLTIRFHRFRFGFSARRIL